MTAAWKRTALGTLVGLSLLLALPSLVAAKSKPLDNFKLNGTHGYEVFGSGHASTVSVLAGKTRGSATSFASYSGTGKATAHVMKVDLAKFGKVKVRFHAKKTIKVGPPKGCTGPKEKKKKGTWKGKIKFKGEGGYTKVTASKAKGSVLVPRKRNCKPQPPKPGTTLDAIRSTPTSSAFFSASRTDGSSKSNFGASEFGQVAAKAPRSGGSAPALQIFRGASVNGPANEFRFDSGLTQAHVTPPSPFSGTADFASPNSWTGSLQVNFPGDKHVKLTGPDFTASLGRGPFAPLRPGVPLGHR